MRIDSGACFVDRCLRRSRPLAGALLMALAAASHAEPRHAVHAVVIDGMQFSPPVLEVKAGDTVVWENRDPFPHTATSDEEGFDSGSILPGHRWKFVAKRPGTYPYSCSLHETMKGTLVVK